MVTKKKGSVGGKKDDEASYSILKVIDENVAYLNNSKFFAGVVIILLNIGSRFINFKFNKSTEKYLKIILSKHLFIFAVVWMGTRDIYLSLIYSSILIFIMDVLLNDESKYCVIPHRYRHLFDMEEDEILNGKVTDEEVDKSRKILEKYENQKKEDFKKEAYQNFLVNH